MPSENVLMNTPKGPVMCAAAKIGVCVKWTSSGSLVTPLCTSRRVNGSCDQCPRAGG